MVQKFGLAIDFETSGFTVPKTPGNISEYASKHQGLSFGALIYSVDTLLPVESMYFEMKFNKKYTWDNGAQAVHGMSEKYLEAKGVTQEHAAFELAKLIFTWCGDKNLLVLGHRPYFDISFLDQLMSTVDLQLHYDPIKIDSAAFGLTFLGVAHSNELFETVGLPARGTHNALEDITYTLTAVRKMRDKLFDGLLQSGF